MSSLDERRSKGTALLDPPEETTLDEETWPEVERRTSLDRRHAPTRLLGRLFGPRRRLSGRREGEDHDIHVDVFGWRDLLLAVSLFGLNVADAFLTLVFLQEGGAEANPLMDKVVQLGENAFLFEKLFVGGIWIFVLTIFNKFRVARYGVYMLFSSYGAVLVYHFYLRSVIHTIG